MVNGMRVSPSTDGLTLLRVSVPLDGALNAMQSTPFKWRFTNRWIHRHFAPPPPPLSHCPPQ